MSVEMNLNLCFVLMPMRDTFIQLYEEVVKPTVEQVGLACLYAGELFGPRPVMQDVWQYCEKARVVIAELTTSNANVYYEAGYSHAYDREKVVFITQDMKEVTFDIRHFRCIVYQTLPRGLKKLREELTKSIEAVLASPPQSPRVVTTTVERIVEIPAPVDARTREALELYDTVKALEDGAFPSSSEKGTRILRLMEKLGGEDIRLQVAVSAYWPELLSAVKLRNRKVYAVLRDCSMEAIEDETLTIKARSRFHYEVLNEPKARRLVEEELERLTQRLRTIRVVVP